MSSEGKRVEAYLGTIGRMEPDLAPVDDAAAMASIAISLKRLADASERGAIGLERIADVVERLEEEGAADAQAADEDTTAG